MLNGAANGHIASENLSTISFFCGDREEKMYFLTCRQAAGIGKVAKTILKEIGRCAHTDVHTHTDVHKHF